MAKLIYSAIASLDGYVADRSGGFGWAEPDPEVHAFLNNLERSVGTYLYGRRMYQVMAAWETMDATPDQTHPTRDFATIWRSADKVGSPGRWTGSPASEHASSDRSIPHRCDG